MAQPHFLLVTFPGQGHINPSLQFAARLLRRGVNVTFVTAVSAMSRMKKGQLPAGLTLATYTDGFDQGISLDAVNHYMSELKRQGSRTLKDYIASIYESQGPKFSRVIYTLLLPWVSDVARDFNIPSTLLWIQPATLLDIYYYHFNGYEDAISSAFKEPFSTVKLPGLPPLRSRDLPSFFGPSNIYGFALPSLEEHFKTLTQETNPKVLVNTFDALELDALRALDGRVNQIAIGPLVPPEILDGNNSSNDSFRGDLFETSKEYVEWLNSKPNSSVVYISFGSMLVLSRQQKGEIARGLLDSGRPFLWVIRESKDGSSENDDDELTCREELEKVGMIVPWCSQVEVLSHPAVGCFVTHCGWNSTSESLAAGVPVVAFPRWTDQTTNAKLIEEVWGTGVRVAENGEGVVEGGEINKCVEVVMGEKGEEMRRNAKKWKDLAREAVEEGGSSDANIDAFVEEVRGRMVVH